ncbi:PilZ domain-containing protein [Thermodesulfobacteriota bacterium]
MEQRRKFQRFPVVLPSRAVDSLGRDGKCSVIEISRGGITLQVNQPKCITAGAMLLLEITIPDRGKPAYAVITLKWLKMVEGRSEDGYFAGGQVSMVTPEDMTELMDYAYRHQLTSLTEESAGATAQAEPAAYANWQTDDMHLIPLKPQTLYTRRRCYDA